MEMQIRARNISSIGGLRGELRLSCAALRYRDYLESDAAAAATTDAGKGSEEEKGAGSRPKCTTSMGRGQDRPPRERGAMQWATYFCLALSNELQL